MPPRAIRLLRLLLHLAATLAGEAFRLIPRLRRFGAAKAAAAAIVPILRINGAWRFRSLPMIETPAETALQMVLRTLDRVGAVYEPSVQIHGAEHFSAARRERRGLLLVGPHAALSKLVVRYLCEQEYSPIIVVAEPMRFAGLSRPPRQIVRSPSFLLRVRTELRAGSIVGAMADHEATGSSRALSVPTSAGTVYLSDGLIRIAQKCGSAVLFIASGQTDDGEIHIYLAPPSPSSLSLQAITSDFAAFVQSHVLRVQQSLSADEERSGPDHRSLPNLGLKP
jgi:lauroyl/myristoyl acyltransferase